MQYLIALLEGIITFISPCILPMIPIYISYFAANTKQKKTVLFHAICFVLGFTTTFTLMGAFAGTIGMFFKGHPKLVQMITGCIIVLFGLHFLDVLKLKWFMRNYDVSKLSAKFGPVFAFLFGMVFILGGLPCVGPFLGSALMMASKEGTVLKGVLMLLCYSIGLGIPFILSAILLDYVRHAFDFIKRHYAVVNKAAGLFLVCMGVLMICGIFDKLLAFLSI